MMYLIKVHELNESFIDKEKYTTHSYLTNTRA